MAAVRGVEASVHIWHAFSHAFADPAGRPVAQGDKWIRLLTGEPHPFGNFVVATDPDDQTLERAVEPLTEIEVPAAVILPLGPSLASREMLSARGFEDVGPMPAMAVRIENLAPAALPEGCRFVQVETARSSQWVECVAESYGMPAGVAEALSPAYANHPAVTFYAIEKDGGFEAASLMVIHDGIAGIYSVATRPSSRGQGMGAYVTSQPLRIALEEGAAATGVLHASKMGYPVYRRLGFEDCGGVPFFVKTRALP